MHETTSWMGWKRQGRGKETQIRAHEVRDFSFSSAQSQVYKVRPQSLSFFEAVR